MSPLLLLPIIIIPFVYFFDSVVILVFLAVLLPIGVIVSQYATITVINYRLSGKSIDIKLWDLIPIVRIPYKQIKEIREINYFLEGVFNPLVFYFRNKIWGGTVLVKRKGGLIVKGVLISPDNRKEFVEKVKKGMRSFSA